MCLRVRSTRKSTRKKERVSEDHVQVAGDPAQAPSRRKNEGVTAEKKEDAPSIGGK